MVLHAVTQIASNGWRGLLWRKHVRWGPVGAYVFGCVLALGAWSLFRYVPSTPIALIFLGVTPFLVKLFPSDWQPNPESRLQGTLYGTVCMTLDAAHRCRRAADRQLLPRRQARPPRDRRHQGDVPDHQPYAEARLFRRHHRTGWHARSGARRARYRLVDGRNDGGQALSRNDERPAVPRLGEPNHCDHRRLLHHPRHGAC